MRFPHRSLDFLAPLEGRIEQYWTHVLPHGKTPWNQAAAAREGGLCYPLGPHVNTSHHSGHSALCVLVLEGTGPTPSCTIFLLICAYFFRTGYAWSACRCIWKNGGMGRKRTSVKGGLFLLSAAHRPRKGGQQEVPHHWPWVPKMARLSFTNGKMSTQEGVLNIRPERALTKTGVPSMLSLWLP